jgi:hypothetical protein
VVGDLGFCFAYIDDILVFSASEEEHLRYLKLAFERLRNHHMVLNRVKCVFGAQEVEYRGHKISSEGTQPPATRVFAINNFLRPETVKDLRRFLSIVNLYRRFVKNAASIQVPLHAYLKNSKKNNKTRHL